MKRVVVISKATRWETERAALNMDGVMLFKELSRRGYPVDRIRASHQAHTKSLEHIMDTLRSHPDIGVVSLRKGRGVSVSDVENADLIVSAGGDGTLLEAASALSLIKSDVKVLSVNTDPMLSAGSLCAVRLWPNEEDASNQRQDIQASEPGTLSTANFEPVLDRVLKNDHSILLRQRIQIELVDENGGTNSIDRLALNEVFYSEVDASRPAVHETIVERPFPGMSKSEVPSSTLDYGIRRTQRSSGVIVCTGTGSTAWMRSARAVPTSEVYRVLTEASEIVKNNHKLANQDSNNKNTLLELLTSREIVNEIAKRMDDLVTFPPTSPNIEYFVREPVLNGWYGRRDQPLSSNPHRGYGRSISIRSLGWDAALTLDGLFTYRIRYGTRAMMKIDPNCPLRAVWFHEKSLPISQQRHNLPNTSIATTTTTKQ